MLWEVYALKYTDRNNRTRVESFLLEDDHLAPHDLDYFIWILRNGETTILVDTGYDETEAKRRGRPIHRSPAQALSEIGIAPESIKDAIISHMHYDHGGSLFDFPNAQFHLQEAEMQYATGPCMCPGVLQKPFTADHICEMVRHVFSGRVTFHDGDGEVAPGVTVHKMGGHSRGLQVARVMTASGPMVLASDAVHYYETLEKRKPFPIVVDVQDSMKVFDKVPKLVERRELIIPGHDPLVRVRFPRMENGPDWATRLDVGPIVSW